MSEITILSGKKPKPLRIAVHGAGGSGKSTFGKEGLFLDIEGGIADIDCKSIDLVGKSTKDIMGALRYIYKEADMIQNELIVVDSLDWLEKILWQSVLEDADWNPKGWTSIEDFGWQKGYIFALKFWKDILNALEAIRQKGFHILLISHSQIVRLENPNLDPYDMVTLKLNKHIRGTILEWCDVVGYVAPEIFTTKTGDAFGNTKFKPTTTGRRLLHLGNNPSYESKTRLALPESLPLNWKDFKSAVADARAEGNSAEPKQSKTVEKESK